MENTTETEGFCSRPCPMCGVIVDHAAPGEPCIPCRMDIDAENSRSEFDPGDR